MHELTRRSGVHTTAVTNLGTLLDGGIKSIKRRSLVVIVSDFISSPGWEASLSILTRRHEVMAVCIRDPREIELPDVGTVVIEDSETGEQLEVDTQDAGFRGRFQGRGARPRATFGRRFQPLGR